MAKKRILLTTQLTDDVMSSLKETYDVIHPSFGLHFQPSECLNLIKGVEAFCPVFYDNIDDTFIQKLPASVKIIASNGVGVNHIDINSAKKKGIIITNTPDVLTAETADLAMGLVISTARKFYEREKSLREGNWTGPKIADNLGIRVSGKTLGIIGMGRIGFAVAKRAKAFDMKIIYHSRHQKPEMEKALDIEFKPEINDIFKKADFISLHIPLSEKTHHIVNQETLSLMKKQCILINTGRGSLVDEKALIEFLKNNKIAGAGLDVYEFEPRLSNDLVNLKNTTLLPHIGSATLETRDAMGFKVMENLKAFFKGNTPPDSIT
ncbi:MAG: 2-hydroxyacid dehydrogenase [Sphingomonadales bacterium]